MISVDRKVWGIRSRAIWLSEQPYDVDDVDCLSFYACNNKVDLDGFQRDDRSTIVIDLTKGIEAIWNNMNSKCRSEIKKAEKENIEIVVNKDHESFVELNQKFRSLKGLDKNEFTPDFMRSYCTLFLAKSEDKPTGGILFISDGVKMRGLIAASKRLESDREMANLIAKSNRLMWWEAIRYGQMNGYSTLDMGGYYTGEQPNPQMEGINEFKRRFGGTVVGDYYYTKNYTLRARLAKGIARSIASYKSGPSHP